MPSRKENIKELLANTRTRVIIIFTFAVLFVAVVVGLLRMHQLSVGPIISARESALSTAPAIRSVPGALNPTAQYVKLQTEENVSQAHDALQKGSSAIPTLIQMQKFGEGVQPVMVEGAVGFTGLARENSEGDTKSLWYDQLKSANCSKESMNQAISEGAALPALRQACSCKDLRGIGYTLVELSPICACPELKAAGFTTAEMKAAGYDAIRLKKCGFNACELAAAGFSARQLLDAGFSPDELKGAGFSEKELAAAAGLPPGMTVSEVHQAGCDVQALKLLREKGVSAAAIRRMNGCDAAQLKAAGFTAAQLRDAGFSAAELAKAGFTAAQLRQAGFSARDLLNAGFTPGELAEAGFTPGEIEAAEAELPPGITAAEVKAAGCSVEALRNERLAGVSAMLIKRYAGCSASALKAAGFSNEDLARAGFSPAQITAADQATMPENMSPVPSAAAATNPMAALAAGRVANCSPSALKAAFLAGVSATTIKDTLGCSASAMKAAGYSAAQLRAAGYTAAELKNAGFTAAELKAAGFSARELKDAGFSASQLKAAGFSASQLRDAGFSAAELKAAGFSAAQLKEAGYSAAELKAAGFSAKELRDAGFSAAELKAAGFSAAQLKEAGYSAAELKAAGFSAKDLKDAGFSAAELKAAGFSAAQLKEAGYSASELKAAGFSDAEIRNAGYSNAELEGAGVHLPAGFVAGLGTEDMPTMSSSIGTFPSAAAGANSDPKSNMHQLQAIVSRQNVEMQTQQYNQAVQTRTGTMLGGANQLLQLWRSAPTQTYVAGTPSKGKAGGATGSETEGTQHGGSAGRSSEGGGSGSQIAFIRAGDILFAVLDTTVNTDEPSPILATIVSGKLKGSKLIGSFTSPSNGDKMIIVFNSISVAGAKRTQSINAFAIDPETGRTALASRVDHHYLSRYGSMFAASFIEGFGNAFQSANTTVTIGGTGGGDNITVQNGVGRSALENAVIGLATVGKSWGQVAQQNMSRPTTIEVFSGTSLGVLFTQDIGVTD